MDINYVDIQIIDTQENDRVLSFEDTSVDAVKLIYNGQDDKFANILTSELQFTFLVKDNTEGKFFHLFTGSETRYKVELLDVSNPTYPKNIWTGFLLSEQFEEPYKNSGYFITFVATDRLALLKNTNYVVKAKQSILNVINSCVLKTGLSFPIFFSEAIQNAGFNIDYLDLEVDTASYFKEEEGLSYFTVLEHVLKSIGCLLFLFENKWYVIGLNKFKEQTISFKKYTSGIFQELELQQSSNYTRAVLNDKFIATPVISIASPLKNVTINWDADYGESLFPEDLVTHLPVNIEANIDDRTVKYWEVVTNKSVLVSVWLLLLDPSFDYTTIDFLSYYQGYKAVKNTSLEDVNQGPFLFINSINAGTVVLEDLETNYITLLEDVYIKGSSDLERFASLELEFFIQKNINKTQAEVQAYFGIGGNITAVANNGSGKARVTSAGHQLTTGDFIQISKTTVYDGAQAVTVIDGNVFDIDIDFDNNRIGEFKILPFAKNFFYAITRKEHKTSTEEEIVLSNFTTVGIPENKFGFDISFQDFDIKGVLNVEKFLLEEDGFYNIRLYPQITNPFLGDFLIYKKCNFNLEGLSEIDFNKKRAIDYTTKLDLDVFHSSSALNLSNRSFTFSDSFKQQLLDGDIVPGQLIVEPISYSSEVKYLNGFPFYTAIEVVLTKGDYLKISAGYTVYVVKVGETEFTEITADSYILNENEAGEFVLVQLVYSSSTFVTIDETDVIYIKAEDLGVSLNYAEYWLDKWRMYDEENDVPMYEVLVDMYHSLLCEYNLLVNGTILNLVSPLEFIAFSFKGDRFFYPVNLELNIHQNTTELTMIEAKNQIISDYE